jgi:methylglutaconyl-CoA hydratase
MAGYSTIDIQFKGRVASIYLNRPAVHNAFDDVMILELTRAFKDLSEASNDEARVVTLEGRGKTFCAGVDINWMKNTFGAPYGKIYEGSLAIAECMHTIYSCKKPTIAKVHGGAFGGATGLLSACDIVYTRPDTVFSLSEVKIGLVPACISPYVIQRVGISRARELMLSGERIDGRIAEAYGLANKSIPEEEFEEFVQSKIRFLKTGGPDAIAMCKKLIHDVADMELEKAKPYTAKMITDIRVSKEGQEGMASFLEKRKPNWLGDD